MPNHVHLLVTSGFPLPVWLGSLKGFTGRQAQLMLNRSGAFWNEESYDHLVRNEDEFSRIKHYIEWNTIRAGLAVLPEEFLWSSAGQKPGSGAEAPPY